MQEVDNGAKAKRKRPPRPERERVTGVISLNQDEVTSRSRSFQRLPQSQASKMSFFGIDLHLTSRPEYYPDGSNHQLTARTRNGYGNLWVLLREFEIVSQ